ncbi:MAG TPA: hypothetical protein VM095_06870 [Pyrinomonadaceae bacterium]|nr:hypothetical protein [Pyrinomonadaceae bacterium]
MGREDLGSRGGARCLTVLNESNSHLGKVPLRNPPASLNGLCRCPRHGDRIRGYGAIIQDKGLKEPKRLLTTEKMLSANRELSNIFLQNGQNIDIADKKAA